VVLDHGAVAFSGEADQLRRDASLRQRLLGT